MDDIFVASLMSTDVVTVTSDTLVEDAAQRLREDRIGSLVVVDSHGRIEGILTSTDFVAIVARSQPKAETTVERYMTEQVISVGAQDPIQDAADTMVTYGISHLPVIDDGDTVIGMLSSTDLTAYLSGVQEPSPA
ncbi:MAG: CBS domain-containing protein [Haloarculaceae archaeon]